MTTEPRTVEQWLALGDALPVELAKAFDDKGKREVRGSPCWLCSIGDCVGCEYFVITIDWKTAMAWRDKSNMVAFISAMDEVAQQVGPNECLYDSALWMVCFSHPKDVLIAAAIAAERSNK